MPRQAAQTRLDAAAKKLPEALPRTLHIEMGIPATTIARRALECGADLIVMGSHGRGKALQLILGSVAQRVIASAHCPVLTVKAPHPH